MKLILSLVLLASMVLVGCPGSPSRPEPMADAGDWSSFCNSQKNCGLCAAEGKCAFCATTNKCVSYSEKDQSASVSCAKLVTTPQKCE